MCSCVCMYVCVWKCCFFYMDCFLIFLQILWQPGLHAYTSVVFYGFDIKLPRHIVAIAKTLDQCPPASRNGKFSPVLSLTVFLWGGGLVYVNDAPYCKILWPMSTLILELIWTLSAIAICHWRVFPLYAICHWGVFQFPNWIDRAVWAKLIFATA